jgi:DNA transformation protein
LGDGFKNFLEDQFAPIPGVSIRKMFGGLGVFRDGIMFGLGGSDEVLYFRADEETRERYEAQGLKPFTYPMRGEDKAMPYWQVPESLFEDPDAFREWAEEAMAAAARAKSAKPAKPAKPKKKTAGKKA